MAFSSIVENISLAYPCVLAPERYDPRRKIATSAGSVLVGDVAQCIRKTVSRISGCTGESFVLLDTSDAREGIVISDKQPTSEIGSTKKITEPGDVIISRLRPYLRQVAYVDQEVPYLGDLKILCSTEFFVLRSSDKKCIAFLVPFLLSPQVQNALSAAQEGGHHPRFDETTLLSMSIPASFLKRREDISKTVRKATHLYREASQAIQELISIAERST